MGFRTVVILNNDHAHEWAVDPLLGRKIVAVSHDHLDPLGKFPGGEVFECVHADTQTLALLDGCSGTWLGSGSWRPGEPTNDRATRLVKEAARRLGYRLVRHQHSPHSPPI